VGLFGVVLAMLLGLAASSFQPQTTLGETGSASANRLWSSGAELNSTDDNVEITSKSGTNSISSSTKRSGDYAYRTNPTSSTGLFYKTWANSTQSNKFWFRTYLRIADDPSANTYVMQVGSGANGKISLRLTTSSTLQLRNEEDNTDIGSASSALSLNTWYRLELYVDTTTLSSTDATFRLDGASIASSTAENLAAAIDRLTWGSSVSGTTDLFFDDIAINDSTGRAVDNWPGEGRIVHMQPNGDSGANNWTGYPSDTDDYDDVDEVTPDGDSTTNYETTANDTRDYDLESATNALIGANDYIKLVSVGARVKNCGQAPGGPACISGEGGIDYSYRTRITAGGNTDESANIGIDEIQSSTYHTNDDDSAKLNKLTAYDLPGTSTAQWTVSDIDGMQIGIKNINTQGYNVTTIWLQVEYSDRSGGRLISSGFELNSAAAGVEVSAVTNTPSINNSTVRTGTYSLSTENGGAQEYARFYFESANTNNDYYARAYLRIATTINNSNATVLSLLDTSNLRRAYLKLTTTSTLELWDEDGQIGSASSALSAGTWYRLELRLNTSPSAGSHVVDGKIDGSSFASASNRSVGTGVARLGLGLNASDSIESNANTQGSLLWDDVALNKAVGTSQNSWPGAGGIIHLYPNATGDNSETWTSAGSGAETACDAGADSNYECLDEVVDTSPIAPDDAVSYVEETTSGDYEDFNIQDSSIGGSDVVNLVSVGVRFRSSSATQEDFRVRVKDASGEIAIESNNISPASTTWTTNATADPKIYPLTAYTRPELSSAWFDSQLDSAQIGLRDVLSGTGTAQVSTAWLLVDYAPPATILVTGSCDQFDQTTDCSDDGANAIAFAVNGTLQGQTDTVVDGAWSISGVTQPSTGDIITVFIDGETTDNEEAVAVAKYDGTGDITGIVLYQRHLTIGSADNQTLSNTDIDAYDNSVSSDEDIFFEVTAGNDLTVDTLGSYTDEELYIVGSNVYQPASGGGGDVTTVHIENDGTFTANTNAITVNGSWQNDGSFGAGTSGVTMNSTTTGRTLSGTMTGGSAFYDLTFNGSGGAWSFSAAAETDRDFIITAGTVTAPSGNLTIARNFTNNGAFTHNSGTVVLDTTTTATVTSASGGTTFNNFTSTTATKTIQFTKHTTGTPVFTFAGTFTITGSSGNLINLYSDTSGTQWKAHFNAHQYSVSFVNLRDGGCDTGTSNVYLDSGSTSVSNNDTCWVFPINRLWSGGAELQSATAQVETNFNDGSALSVNTTTKRSGAAAWRVNPTSSNAAFNKYYVNTPTQGKYWARFYIYVASAPNTEVGIFNFNGSGTRISVRMNTDRSIELWNEEDNAQIGSASSALSASTWYRVEVYHDTTTLSSTSAELRLNGSSVASGTANLAGASDRVQWGVLETAGTADLYFDDIAVNGPSSAADNWPGEGKIVHMQPNGDGDNVAWTDSSGNAVDYDEVDDSDANNPTAPDDGTTYIHSSSGGNVEDLDLETSANAGIGANDTITAVSVGLRFRACNSGGACLIASGDNYKARIKASSGGTLEESASYNADNISYSTNYNTTTPTANLYPITLLDLPGSSASKWTPTNLDSAQIGMNHVSHENGFRTSTIWLLVEYVPVTTVAGTCDQYDQTTDCVDDGSNEIKVAINGSLQGGSDATVDGSWSVAISTPTTGDVITVFINGETTENEEANAVTVYDGTGDVSGVVLFQRHLTIGSADNQTITNANLASYDNSVSSDEDIFFDVAAGNDLTVDSLASYTDEELYVVTGNTFRPASGGGADVTTVDVENDGTWTADSNSIFVGGSWQNDGTFTAGTSTVDFTATSTSKTLSGTLTGSTGQFSALTFSGSGGGWSNSSAMAVTGVLTMTNGTLSGTNDITVNGNVQGTSGAISLTGGTFEHALTSNRNFGTTSGSTAWTFNNLTFSNTCTSLCGGRTATTQTGGTGDITVTGILRIGKSGDSAGATTTLNAGNRTWTLSGTGGDPFQILASPAGSLSASTSTFTYSGNNGAGNTTVQTATYNNLSINNGSETYVLEGTTNCNGNFDSTAGTLDTTSANSYAMTVTGNWTMASGSTVVANASTITVSGNWDQNNTSWNTAATGSGTSTVVLSGTTKTLSTTGTASSDRHFYNLTVNGSYTKVAGERINIYNNFIMNTSSSLADIEFSPGGLHIWSGSATVTINGTLSKAAGTGSMFIRTSMPTITTSVGIDVRVDYYMGAVGTHVIPALNYRGGLLFRSDENNTLRLGSGTFDIGYGDTNNFTMSTDTTGKSSTVDCATNAPTVNVSQDVIFSSALGSTTLNLGACTFNVGRGWTNTDGASITVGTSTVNFSNDTADGDITSNGQSFYNVTVNDTGDDITITDALVVANDLTMTAGDLNGSQNVTVNGTVQGTSGTITMTGGTFEQRVTANENFGTTSGSTAWTFSDLTFSNASVLDNWWTITTQTGGTGGITVSGVMRVNRAAGANDNDGIILTGGNRTWTLSGTGGNPLRMETTDFGGFIGQITPGTSTFTFTGNNAGGNTTVEQNPSGVGYYNLDINNSSETFVLEGNTTVGNDLTVTNGLLDTTGSNHSLTVTRDLTLSNTAGVGLTANGSTISISRHFNDTGDKYTHGTSTLTMAGTGTFTVANNSTFYNVQMGASTFTTTLSSNNWNINNVLTFNGGSVSSSGSYTNLVCSTSCTPVVFSSATTLSGTRTLYHRSDAASTTITIAGGNYGSWGISNYAATGNNSTFQLGGNITTTAVAPEVQATNGITGSVFTTTGSNYSITSSSMNIAPCAPTRTGSWTINLNNSVVTHSSSTTGITVGLDCGSHTLNLGGSSVDVKGNVSFVNGTGTVSVTPGTSTVSWTHSSGTKTYTPNSQSLHHLTLNASGGTLQPAGAVDVNGNFTISAGIYDTVNGSNYALNVGGNFTNNGTFTARNATVTLDGSSEQNVSGTLTGSSAFYNMTVTNSSGTNASDCERTGFVPSIDFDAAATVTNNTTFTTASSRVEFNSGSSYTLTNINWNGQASGTRLYFRNSAASGSWSLNVSGTQTAVSYVNVSRSDASSGSTIQAASGTNTDCGNNVNWSFNNPGSPSSLAQKKTNDTVIALAGWTNETSVKFTATISDADSNTVQLCVENADIFDAFTNTETLCGSLVSSGSTATVTISGLTNGSEYHWQARSKDSAGYYSSWVGFGGNSDVGDPADRDFGVDTTACTYAGTIYDGDTEDVDASFNDGSLEELLANWDAFSCGASGISQYDVSIGTTVGGTDILSWTNNGPTEDSTQAGLVLRTNQKYYYNVRAVDNASNTSSVYSSNGQDVLPTISFTLGSTTLTFAGLNDNNNRTDSKTLTLTTSTNAYGGYVVRQYATGLLTNGSDTIPLFQAGSYASPAAWPGSFCTTGVNCGYGYTSSDTTIQGSNKFSTGTLYAAFATAAFGDIVADHTTNVTGATGPVTGEAFTITHKVSVDALQKAKTYQTEVLYIVTGTF
jgi:hypothetical protein